MLSHTEKQEMVDALVARYIAGDMSEPVFTASLKCKGLRQDDIRELLISNRAAHRNSLPYRRGHIA